jgi:hypothetical protein
MATYRSFYRSSFGALTLAEASDACERDLVGTLGVRGTRSEPKGTRRPGSVLTERAERAVLARVVQQRLAVVRACRFNNADDDGDRR